MANSFTRKITKDIGTAEVIIGNYTVASSTIATVIGMSLANVSSSAITVEVYISDGTTLGHLIKNALIPVGGSLVVVGGDQKVVLTTGDSVRVKSSAATSVDAIMSILEIA